MSYIDNAMEEIGELMLNRGNALDLLGLFSKGERFVLQFLSLRDEPVIPSTLSEALRSSTPRISALLGSLEKKGLVIREIDKTNRRNILVTLTPEGRSQVNNMKCDMYNRMTKVFTELGESDTKEFVRLMKRVTELIQETV